MSSYIKTTLEFAADRQTPLGLAFHGLEMHMDLLKECFRLKV